MVRCFLVVEGWVADPVEVLLELVEVVVGCLLDLEGVAVDWLLRWIREW